MISQKPPDTEPPDPSERILLLTPTGRDAELMAGMLTQAGFVPSVHRDVTELCAAIQEGGGAAVVAEEALGGKAPDLLDATLGQQPSWSDLPIVVLLGPGVTLASSRTLLSRLSGQGNVTLLERPVRTVALISTLHSALRARRRQYEVRDYLTERAQAQAALEQSEARYRSLTLASVSIVWTADPGGAMAGDAPSWETYTGQSRDQYQGWGWLQAIHPEDRDSAATRWRKAVKSNQTYYAEYRLARREGDYRRVTARAVPVRGPDGSLIEWVGTCTDVEDERRVAEHLRHRQRIEAVGKLAGGMAHEVNNMMSAVIGFGQFVLNSLPADSPQYADVTEMVKAASRSAGVTRQLLAFTRQQILQPSVIDLNAVITELVPMLRGFVGADRELRLELAEEGVAIRADRGQLEQVIVNLTLNAQYAMDSGGRLTIETGEILLAPGERLGEGVDAPPGRYALLALTDTGCGMDSATLARAFEPFYTTKPVGEGTGLGLSVVYGIVKQSGGYIWLYSEPGQGTSVKIYLPLVAAEPAPDRPATNEAAPRGAGETVLVLEDEDAVRVIARRALEGAGYAVIEAANGREGLAVIERSTTPIDLILCDVIMPETQVREVAQRAAQFRPGVPILYTSAFPGAEVISRGLMPPDAPFIGKPFTPHDLSVAVRAMLDRSAAKWPHVERRARAR